MFRWPIVGVSLLYSLPRTFGGDLSRPACPTGRSLSNTCMRAVSTFRPDDDSERTQLDSSDCKDFSRVFRNHTQLDFDRRYADATERHHRFGLFVSHVEKAHAMNTDPTRPPQHTATYGVTQYVQLLSCRLLASRFGFSTFNFRLSNF
jgi:hypothetical protein